MNVKTLSLLILIALVSCSSGKNDEAKQLFDTAWDTKDEELRMANHKKIIDIAPDSPYGLYCKAWFLDEEEKFADALAISENLVAQYPNFWQGWSIRASFKRNLDDKQGAVQDYNEVIKLNPKNENSYINRGILKDDLGDKQGAMLDYNEAIRLNPKNEANYGNRGVLKQTLGDTQGAMLDYNEAINLNPEDQFTYFNRGSLKHDLGDAKGAIEDYSTTISLNPSFVFINMAYFNRGLLEVKLGEKQSACADFSKAGELGHMQAYDAIKKFCQ